MMETNDNIILGSERVIMDSEDSDLFISIPLSDSDILRLTLRFLIDDKKKGIQTVAENDRLVVLCYNMNESLGQFTLSPIEIAKYKDKNILMQIFSALNGNEKKIRQVEFTIYMEK